MQAAANQIAAQGTRGDTAAAKAGRGCGHAGRAATKAEGINGSNGKRVLFWGLRV